MINKLIIYICPILPFLVILILASFLYCFKYQLPIVGSLLIKRYYDFGVYEKDVEKICSKAKSYFAGLEVLDNSLIIFDVDDTAVYNFRYRATTNLKAPKTIAILPVLELYKYLVQKGFKIIFLSSRANEMSEFTKKELIGAGYTKFEDLICKPSKFSDDYTAVWKAERRKELAVKYRIVGSVADRKRDFFDNYNGHIVSLPNYLY